MLELEEATACFYKRKLWGNTAMPNCLCTVNSCFCPTTAKLSGWGTVACKPKIFMIWSFKNMFEDLYSKKTWIENLENNFVDTKSKNH